MIVMRPTESELHLAAQVGVLRAIEAFRRTTPQRYGCEDAGFASHINGALGEMMLAKHLNLYWAGAVGNKKAADVNRHYQTRATDHASGRLIIHPPDADVQPFILARVRLPEVHLVGWLYGSEAKQQLWWRETARPAYFVDTDALRDMALLPNQAEIERLQSGAAA